jgi:hypothetical protein
MVNNRQLSKQRMIFALIITLLIFAVGFLLGMVVDYERLVTSGQSNQNQEMNYNSLQLQYLYLSNLGTSENVCPTLRVALEDSIKELSYSLEAFDRYSQNTLFQDAPYEALERKYLQDNLRYWLFSTQLQQACESDVINVLYFYSDKDCAVCQNQGTVLTYFKQKLDDKLLVFPVNVDLAEEEQFLTILTTSYNVTQLPTLIINDNKLEGVQSRDQLSRVICEQTTNKETCLI